MRRFLLGFALALTLGVAALPAFSASWTYRSTGSVSTASGGAAVNPGACSGKAVGDLMILTTATRDNNRVVTEDTGWTNIFTDNNAQQPSMEVWARIADGTADDTATADWDGSVTSIAWISCYSGGGYTDLATIVAHTNSGEINENSDITVASLTITTDNTLLLVTGVKTKTATSNDASTITTSAGSPSLTKRLQFIGTGTGFFGVEASAQETTATNYDGTDFTRDGTNETGTSTVVLFALQTAAAAPTFTAGPTAGTKTQTTVPFTFTSDTTGTVKGVACPDGQANPTVAQVLAGNCTGNVAAVATISQAVTAAVGNSGTFSGLTKNTTYDTHFAIDASTDSAAITSVANQTTVNSPTFSAGPTAGTPTSTTIPVTFTSDQTGTVKGVACPDGQAAPTVAQVLAGNCTGNIAAEAAFSQAVVATVGDSDTFTSLAPATRYDTHYAQTNSAGDSSAISSALNVDTAAAGGGTFSVNPTVTSQTTSQYTLGGTTTAAATVSVVVCAKDSTAPTKAQVIAGDCTGNVDAIASNSTSWNGAGTINVGGSLVFPIHDVYATDGTSVVTLADENLDVPAGKQRLTLTSVDATSPYFGQGVAASDICTIDTVTDPDSFVVTDDVDGTVSYAAGGSFNRELIDSQCYDVSSPANLDFLLVYNNQAPVVDELSEGDDVFFDDFLIQKDSTEEFDLSEMSSDPEGDDVDFTVVSGALATGRSLNSETGLLSGTYSACEDVVFTIRMTDAYGATTDVDNTQFVGPLVPDVSGNSEASAITAIEAACSLSAVAGNTQASGSVAEGNVVQTDPVSGTLVRPDAEITYFLSSGPATTGAGGGLQLCYGGLRC